MYSCLWLPDWPIVVLFFLLPDLRSVIVHCISCLSKGGCSQHQRRRKRSIRISSIFYCIKSPRGKTLPILKLSCDFLLLGSHRCGSVAVSSQPTDYCLGWLGPISGASSKTFGWVKRLSPSLIERFIFKERMNDVCPDCHPRRIPDFLSVVGLWNILRRQVWKRKPTNILAHV